jgi:acylglycerol lipase
MQPFSLGHLSVWHHTTATSVAKRGRVLLIHGLSEHSGRHLNTVHWLNQSGYEVVRFDLRGAGLSGGRRQWIERFEDYIEDTTQVHLWIQRNLDRQPLFVLGHSLGGAIALYFSSRYGNQFDGLVVSAPGYLPGSNIPAWKLTVGKNLARFFPTLRIPGGGDNSALSRDPAVCEAYANDALSSRFNTLQQGNQILRALEQLETVCQKIAVPTAIFHGTADRVVLHEGSYLLFRQLATKHKELHFLPGAYHEPHNDLDKAHYFQLLTNWLNHFSFKSDA